VTRRIISVQQQANTGPQIDNFVSRIVKYVPADIVAAWLALAAMLAPGHRVVLWIVFAFLLVLTPVWTLRVTRAEGERPAFVQAGVSTTAFAIWVFATGEPFSALGWYEPVFGGVVIILFTVVSGLIVPADSRA